jgi:hypothetical protein
MIAASDPRVLAVAVAIVALYDALREPSPSAGPTHYTTNKRGALPPGKSRRWLRDRAAEIPGARKVGRDWTVSAADFDRWAAARTPKRTAPVVPLRTATWSPSVALEAAGVRTSNATRGP